MLPTSSKPFRSFKGIGVSALAAVAVLALQACATVYEGRYAWADGWRDVRVEEIQLGSEISDPQFWNCVRAAIPAQRATDRFALVSYLQTGKRKRSMIPLAETYRPSVGQQMFANLSTCEVRPHGAGPDLLRSEKR